MEKITKNTVEKYQRLSPFFKTVVQLLAIQVFEFWQKDLIYCLNALGFSDCGRLCHPHGPMVESGSGRPGFGPGSQNWPDQACDRISPGCQRFN